MACSNGSIVRTRSGILYEVIMTASAISKIYNILQQNYEKDYEAWVEADQSNQGKDVVDVLWNQLRETANVLEDFNNGGWRCG